MWVLQIESKFELLLLIRLTIFWLNSGKKMTQSTSSVILKLPKCFNLIIRCTPAQQLPLLMTNLKWAVLIIVDSQKVAIRSGRKGTNLRDRITLSSNSTSEMDCVTLSKTFNLNSQYPSPRKLSKNYKFQSSCWWALLEAVALAGVPIPPQNHVSF